MDVCDERSVYRAAEFVGEALVEGKSGEGWLEGGEEEGEEKGRQPQHQQQQQQQQQRKTGGGRGGGEGQGEAIAALLGGGTSSSRKNGNGSLPLRLLRSRGGGSGSGSGSGGIRGVSEPPQPVRRRRQRAPSHAALLAGLVNCAGVAVPGPLLHQPLSEIRRQMEVNFFGACCVTQAFAPLLGAGRGERTEEKREAGVDTGCEDASSSPPSSSSSAFSSSSPPFSRFSASSFPVSNPGTIVQISSTAGKLSAPFIGAYAASKHALEAASDALRRELVPYGCDLLVLEPGAVATPIWDKAEGHDVSAYDGTPYKGPLKVFGEIVRAEGRVSFFDVFFLLLQTKKLKKTQKTHSLSSNSSPSKKLKNTGTGGPHPSADRRHRRRPPRPDAEEEAEEFALPLLAPLAALLAALRAPSDPDDVHLPQGQELDPPAPAPRQAQRPRGRGGAGDAAGAFLQERERGRPCLGGARGGREGEGERLCCCCRCRRRCRCRCRCQRELLLGAAAAAAAALLRSMRRRRGGLRRRNDQLCLARRRGSLKKLKDRVSTLQGF